jgi:hypothetical protein
LIKDESKTGVFPSMTLHVGKGCGQHGRRDGANRLSVAKFRLVIGKSLLDI